MSDDQADPSNRQAGGGYPSNSRESDRNGVPFDGIERQDGRRERQGGEYDQDQADRRGWAEMHSRWLVAAAVTGVALSFLSLIVAVLSFIGAQASSDDSARSAAAAEASARAAQLQARASLAVAEQGKRQLAFTQEGLRLSANSVRAARDQALALQRAAIDQERTAAGRGRTLQVVLGDLPINPIAGQQFSAHYALQNVGEAPILIRHLYHLVAFTPKPDDGNFIAIQAYLSRQKLLNRTLTQNASLPLTATHPDVVQEKYLSQYRDGKLTPQLVIVIEYSDAAKTVHHLYGCYYVGSASEGKPAKVCPTPLED